MRRDSRSLCHVEHETSPSTLIVTLQVGIGDEWKISPKGGNDGGADRYMKFLRYLDLKNVKSKSDNWSRIQNKVKDYLFDSGLTQKANDLIKEALEYKAARKKTLDFFTAKGLTGRELGEAMTNYINKFNSKGEFAYFVNSSDL